MTDALKPCPFCGCSVIITEETRRDDIFGTRTWYYITGEHTGIGSICPGEVRGRGSAETAIAAWNTRTAPPAWPENARFQYGDAVRVIVKREGQPRFPGYVIGWYQPLDGRHNGWVLEHERDGLVHVYPDAAIEWEVGA